MGNDKVNENNLTIFTKKSRGFFHKNFGHFAIALSRQKFITASLSFYLCPYCFPMNQLILLTPADISQRTSYLGDIKATFTPSGENQFDIVLEINSNKFMITMQNISDRIEEFQIIAMKGFIELSNSIILMIKRLVEHLRYRI